MKTYYNQKAVADTVVEEDFTPITLHDSIEKTREALDIAYAGFDYAVETDLIDSYIYEINSLQKRYKHLTDLAAARGTAEEPRLYKHSTIRTLVSHIFS